MKSFKQIYLDSLSNSNESDLKITDSIFSRPVAYRGLISPKSNIDVNHKHNITFSLDQNGMEKVIDIFQDFWDSQPESNKSNLVTILTGISNSVSEYFESDVPSEPNELLSAYLNSPDNHLDLSEMQGITPGITLEQPAVAHQLLCILNKAGIIPIFEPTIITTNLSTKANTKDRLPWSLLLLLNKKDFDNSFLVDINCPISYIDSNKTPAEALAIFSVDKKNLESFLSGKGISPKSIYELGGYHLNELGKRIYGNTEPISLEQDEPVH